MNLVLSEFFFNRYKEWAKKLEMKRVNVLSFHGDRG